MRVGDVVVFRRGRRRVAAYVERFGDGVFYGRQVRAPGKHEIRIPNDARPADPGHARLTQNRREETR